MTKGFTKLRRKLTAAHLLAVSFLVYILFVSLAALPEFLYHLGGAFYWDTGYKHFIETVDQQYSGMLSTDKDAPLLQNKGSYINFNGAMARLLGQPMMNDRVLLKNGHLSHVLPNAPEPEAIQAAAENVIRFSRRQTGSGGSFLFVMAPSQISKYEDLLPAGYTDATNQTADTFLALLEEAGVDCLDLREQMHAEGISSADSHYTTDHHWTPQTGFWAFGKILKKLEAMGAISPVDPLYTSPENYTFEIYEDTFLGSSGKRTGIHFAGLDDSIYIRPNFETDLSVRIPERQLELRGRYEEVAYNTEAFHDYEDPNFYLENSYGLYGWGDTKITHWRNEAPAQAGKFLLIGESFGNVPYSLMSLCFESCDEVDRRYFDEDFRGYYEAYGPDTVILEVNVDMTVSENTSFAYPG